MTARTVLIAIGLAALVVAGGLLARRAAPDDSAGGRPPMGNAPAVAVAAASKATLSLGLALTGSVEAHRVARLASSAEGPVLDVRVREGDGVRAGEALLAIGRTQGVDALVASLRDELETEADNLRRTRQLVDNRAIPAEQLDRARTAHERIRAQLARAEEAARDYTVEAPWDGVVSRLLVQEGEFVAPRAGLLEIYDPSSLVIRAAVPEGHAARVAAGLRVEVGLDAYPGAAFGGRVERVYPYLDPRLRTRTVEIVLDESVALIPGMFARLRVLLTTVHDAVTVPAEALVATPAGPGVYVVVDGKAALRPVTPGLEDGDRVEIRAGLQPGERVVVAGGRNLRDGAAVSLPAEAPPVTAAGQGSGMRGGGR